MGYFEGEPELTSNEIPITTTCDVLSKNNHSYKIAVQFQISWLNVFKHREKLNSFPIVFNAIMIGRSYQKFSIDLGFLVTRDKALDLIEEITTIGGKINSVAKSYCSTEEDFEKTKKEIIMMLEHCKILLS